jgi:peroxiredoxin
MNRLDRWRPFLATALAGFTAQGVGCQKPSSASTESSAAASAPAASAAVARKPSPKATTTTGDAELGKLPEGVGIAVGSPAADGKLQDAGGKAVQLADFWKKGWVLLVFYRGGWCPYCNFQVRELTRALPELDKRAVTPVLISVDRVSEAAKTSATYEIPYPVLSDPELVVHRGFRVLQQVDDATLAKYRDFGIDLEGSSGQKHHTIAVPSLFLVDKDGIVRFSHADRDYKVRPSTAQILAAIDRAQGQKAPN